MKCLDIFDKNSKADDENDVIKFLENKLKRDLSKERMDFPCIVAASRLDPKKNHLGLVEAYASSPELRQIANLVIMTGNLEDPLNGFDNAGITEKSVLESLLNVIDKQNLRGQVSMFAIKGQRHRCNDFRFTTTSAGRWNTGHCDVR